MHSTFSFPTTTVFGAGARRELREWLARLGGLRPLVVTDTGLAKTSAFALLETSLEGAGAAVCAKVRPNPVEEDVEEAFRAFRQSGCGAVIAFGGGSALDVGKAVRLRIKRPEKTLAQFDFGADWSGLAPLVAVPTTAGTGGRVRRSSGVIIVHPECA